MLSAASPLAELVADALPAAAGGLFGGCASHIGFRLHRTAAGILRLSGCSDETKWRQNVASRCEIQVFATYPAAKQQCQLQTLRRYMQEAKNRHKKDSTIADV